MQKRFYVDTSIWRDYFEDRRDGIKPLGEFAFQFFKYCNENNCLVFYSDFVVLELKGLFSEEEIRLIFSIVKKHLLTKVSATEKQLAESYNMKKIFKEIPLYDLIHAIMARDSNAILVSRDKHFEYLNKIVEYKLPEKIT